MAENDMLAERAEDSLLLGLISEKVSLCDDADELDGIALEQATVLKDLAAGLCIEVETGTATIADSFIMYGSMSPRGITLKTDSDFSSALAAGEAYQIASCEPGGFFSTLNGVIPMRFNAWLALEAGRRHGHDCVYLFADEECNPRLPQVSSMLRRVIEIVISRRQNLELVEELRKLNTSLDSLVEARTVELQTANTDLKAEIAARLQTENKLRASLNEKTVLLKEVHHRVKNNLQIVSSLLSIQANGIEEDTLRNKFSESQDRVHAMALVHEQLYQSEDMSHIDFGEYLKELSGRLQQVYARPGVTTVVEAEDISLSLDQSIPCGLLASELISNAYKHAFKGRDMGTLMIRIGCENGGTIVLDIKDDGMGLSEASSPGKKNTIGLTLVHLLADQLGGSVGHGTGAGCHFMIRFPRQNPFDSNL